LDFLVLIFDLTLFFFYTLIKIVNLNSLFGIFDKKLTKLVIYTFVIFSKLNISYDA